MGQDKNNKVDCINGTNGLSLIDLKNIEQEIETKSFVIPIMNTILGANTELVFSEANQKLVLVENYHQITMIPVVHQNVLNFEGIKRKSEYLAFKQVNDKFIALDKNNRLITWCMQTGNRLIDTENITTDGEGFSDYRVFECEAEDTTERESDIYRKGHFPFSLLYSKAETKTTDEIFYGERLDNDFADTSASYLRNLDKTFHKFKLIEIISSTEVKTHFYFTFTKLFGNME